MFLERFELDRLAVSTAKECLLLQTCQYHLAIQSTDLLRVPTFCSSPALANRRRYVGDRWQPSRRWDCVARKRRGKRFGQRAAVFATSAVGLIPEITQLRLQSLAVGESLWP